MHLVHEGVFKIGGGVASCMFLNAQLQLQLRNHTPANCIRSCLEGKNGVGYGTERAFFTFQRSDFGFTDFKIVIAVKEAFR